MALARKDRSSSGRPATRSANGTNPPLTSCPVLAGAANLQRQGSRARPCGYGEEKRTSAEQLVVLGKAGIEVAALERAYPGEDCQRSHAVGRQHRDRATGVQVAEGGHQLDRVGIDRDGCGCLVASDSVEHEEAVVIPRRQLAYTKARRHRPEHRVRGVEYVALEIQVIAHG